jgi:hypothetical protein
MELKGFRSLWNQLPAIQQFNKQGCEQLLAVQKFAQGYNRITRKMAKDLTELGCQLH